MLDHYTLGEPLPEKAVLITFDDGYRDTLENALPVLQKHGHGAVIFIPVAYMEDQTRSRTRPISSSAGCATRRSTGA